MGDSSVLCVPGSTSRDDFTRCVRAIKARMNAFQRGPLFFYSPVSSDDGGAQARLEQVRALTTELAGIDIPSDVAYMMRTSGSASGTGKIVFLSTAALVASAEATAQALDGPGRWTVCLPPAHIAGFQTIFRSLLAGTEPVWAGSGKPSDIVRAVNTYRAGERAYLSLVPVQLMKLVEDADALRAARRYHAILVGGAACSPDLVERARSKGLYLVQTYGMTETCGGCVYDGFPIGDTRVTVDDSRRISVSGSCVALGYGSGERFAGTFHTSDCGFMDSHGKLSVTGRLDRAITSGGVTVIPEVVERHIEEAWGVHAVVVGVDDDTWGQVVVACTDAPVDDAREVLKEKLETGWVPRHFVTLDDLGLDDFPRLSSGKIDRHALSEHVSNASKQ